jgi:hypothetical protein
LRGRGQGALGGDYGGDSVGLYLARPVR